MMTDAKIAALPWAEPETRPNTLKLRWACDSITVTLLLKK